MNAITMGAGMEGASLARPTVDDAMGEFTHWVRPHQAAMIRYAARLVGPAAAEDVVQEALVRAWRRWSTYDAGRGEPLGWLLAIVADRARRVRRRPHEVSLRDHDDAEDPPGYDVDLERAIAALSPRQRESIDLYYFVGLDVADVARVMGCAPGTVRATLHQARAALRTLLGEDHG